MKARYANNLFYEYQYYAHARMVELYNNLVIQYNWLVDENRRLSDEIRRLQRQLEILGRDEVSRENYFHTSLPSVASPENFESTTNISSVHQNQMEVIREMQHKKPIQMSFDE
jgi:hypothetical protein